MLRRATTAAVVGVLGAVLLAAAPAASAAPFGAGSGGSTGSGYQVTATVTFSGDAAPAGGGTVSRSVPATCWWQPVEGVPAGDGDAAAAWFMEQQEDIEGTFAVGRVAYGTPDDWRAVAERQLAGEDLSYHRATCRRDAPEGALAAFAGRTYDGGAQHGIVAVTYAAFPTGAAPEPVIDPADLAQLARDEMEIPEPQVDRNPRSTGLDATFVGLPTWFWVLDEGSVGGVTGTRTIRATVGGVWAEVTARTGGLTVSSPAGAVTCEPQRATLAWGAGRDDDAGCTLVFDRASTGDPRGHLVDLGTTWTASYTASEGPGGPLDPLSRQDQTYVPVAESQSLVRPGR